MPAKTSKLRSLQYELKNRLSIDDREWRFDITGLPSPQQLSEARLVKSIALDTKGYEQRMILKYSIHEPTRATEFHPLDKFLVLSAADFRPLPGLKPESSGTHPSTHREYTEYLERLLRAGITLQGDTYHFYGHSNSQLKSRTCFMFAAPKVEIRRMVESLGEFATMKTVAKKAKRIGLLFSTAHAVVEVEERRCEDIADLEAKGYIFTDGCGLMAPRFAQDVSRRMRLTFGGRRHSPSVFQIRYRGYKGVVTGDPRMKNGPAWLRLRKSMKKFNGGDDHSFSVVGYSKPFVFGHLNDEVVLLLHALGVSREVLLRKQQEHFAFLDEAHRDPRQAFRFLCHVSRHDLAERVLMDSLESVQPQVRALIQAEYSKMLNKRHEQRCRILVPQSRLIFGVCDAWGVLKEGECAVKITKGGDGLAYALKNTEVLVTRNPCLHPGDLQKIKVVEHPALSHLIDCIVFPTRGRRPPADMMSGGDLDGDMFFVCWDSDLVPSTLHQPAEYPGGLEPVQFNPITDDDRLVYFARYTNASLGRVKNSYLDWARVKGPMAPECQELNRLFSQCVDGTIIKVPPRLESAPIATPETPKFILDELHEAATAGISFTRVRPVDVDAMDFDAIELLLSRQGIAITEFELLELTARWCRRNRASLADFLPYFDLNSLTIDQKHWVLSSTPQLNHLPSIVLNALCTSSIISGDALACHKLNSSQLRWKRVYDSSQERLATFMDTAAKTLKLFHKKLVVIQVDERLSLVIYIPQKIERSQDFLVHDTIRVFAFTSANDSLNSGLISRPTKKNYRLFCDENLFQLFEGQRHNTWIFIGRRASNDAAYRNTTNQGDRRRRRQATIVDGQNFDFRASVALDKFSRGLQQNIGRVNRNGVLAAEIYVISNRDVQSMKNLDLWLQYIETREIIPLFDEEPRIYSLEVPSGTDMAEVPLHLQKILQEGMIGIDDIKSHEELTEVLKWLRQHSNNRAIISIFDHVLSRVGVEGSDIGRLSWQIDALLDHLSLTPSMAARFTGFDTWSPTTLPEPISLKLQARGQDILKGVTLCARDAGNLAVTFFESVLTRLDSLSLDGVVKLVELCALTIHSPDLAMDFLVQCLERQSLRLLSGAAEPALITYFVKNVIAIALDHISEAHEQQVARPDLLTLRDLREERDGYSLVECTFRIDATKAPETWSHVRLTAASLPVDAPLASQAFIDALVVHSHLGSAKFQCFHQLPPFLERCSWTLTYCGPFVTSQTMLCAVRLFADMRGEFCSISREVLGLTTAPIVPSTWEENMNKPTCGTSNIQLSLNDSQRNAVHASLACPLVLIWGPPGTGKTQTIVTILISLLRQFPDERILVTAPTHNAVDNVMRRYLGKEGLNRPIALRVSTEVRKVAEDLRKHTLDGLAGSEIYESHTAMREAKKRVKSCRVAFSTCIGAGIGLLRSEDFGIVIIDEASQQTEPASLVPLTKTCKRAVLVGDHVQLRPTVQPITTTLDHDVSLFERLYTSCKDLATDGERLPNVQTLMLDTQYRMHKSICDFSSEEFYQGQLHTGVGVDERPLVHSSFPWPSSSVPGDFGRTVFIECNGREDLGQRSKCNRPQAELCRRVLQLLLEVPISEGSEKQTKQSIVVLTPYNAQRTLLKSTAVSGLKGDIEVFSIDGYQGREADIVVFSTVRCNDRGEIGFLGDLRRMNVALTRAKSGLIILGCRSTLTAMSSTAQGEGGGIHAAATWKRLLERLTEVKL